MVTFVVVQSYCLSACVEEEAVDNISHIDSHQLTSVSIAKRQHQKTSLFSGSISIA